MGSPSITKKTRSGNTIEGLVDAEQVGPSDYEILVKKYEELDKKYAELLGKQSTTDSNLEDKFNLLSKNIFAAYEQFKKDCWVQIDEYKQQLLTKYENFTKEMSHYPYATKDYVNDRIPNDYVKEEELMDLTQDYVDEEELEKFFAEFEKQIIRTIQSNAEQAEAERKAKIPQLDIKSVDGNLQTYILDSCGLYCITHQDTKSLVSIDDLDEHSVFSSIIAADGIEYRAEQYGNILVFMKKQFDEWYNCSFDSVKQILKYE